MGRAQQAKTNQMNDSSMAQSNSDWRNFNSQQNSIGNQNQSNANQSFTGASGVYDHLAQGYDGDIGSGGNFGGGGGSRAGAAGYNAEGYTGEGYSSNHPQFHLRAIDPNNLADAKAGYGEFAKTGGIDEATKGNFRLRSNAATPSFYSNLKNQMATRRNVQGGYGSGFDAADEALARRSAQDTYAAGVNTEGALQDRVTAGRQWGIGGQADIGKFSDDLQLRHDVAEGNFSEAFANRGDTASRFSAGARNDANRFSAGERNNASAFNASAANSASSANAGLDERAREFNVDQDFQRRQAAGSGYSGLYADSNSAGGAANQRWLGGLGGNQQGNQAAIDSRFQNNRPWGQTLANSLIGGAAGAAGTYFSGGFNRRQPRAVAG